MIGAGIRRKVVLVLLGVLAGSTALNVLLSSHLTERQHEQAAYSALELGLAAWQTDLEAHARRMRRVAVTMVDNGGMLHQLEELMTLDLAAASPGSAEQRELARSLGYRKAVLLRQLQVGLHAGGLSRIEVWTAGRLSHWVSHQSAGMRLVAEEGNSRWVQTQTDEHGELPLRTWPAWPEAHPDSRPPETPQTPGVSILADEEGAFKIRAVVPVVGLEHTVTTDSVQLPSRRFYSRFAVGGSLQPPLKVAADAPVPAPVALVVFDLVIDRTMLEDVARRSGQLPLMISPDGRRQHKLPGVFPMSAELLDPAATVAGAQARRHVVPFGQGSYYVALKPWLFEGRPAMLLALAVSRESTLDNVRQTVLAILLAAGATMLVGALIGLAGVRRFIDPLTRLTAGVRAMSRRGAGGAAHLAQDRLQPVQVDARDEVGELAEAFNDLVHELQQSMETLEHRVLDRTAELRQQARYLRTLIDMLPMRAWFKDAQGRFLAVNRAEAEHLGRPAEALIGCSDFDIRPPEEARAQHAADQEVMSTLQHRTREEPPSGTGSDGWLETYHAAVTDLDGTVLGTIGIARDISDRKASEAAREAALAEAQKLVRLRSDFLARMSHELRTPLNGILGFAQLLQAESGLDARQQRNLKIIEDSGKHLLALINDILDLARIDADRVEMHVEEVVLQEFVRSVCDVVRVKAVQKGLAFSWQAGDELPTAVRVDGRLLRQVLLNLLSNAVKFTDRGTVALRVASRPVPADDGDPQAFVHLRFEVEDTGAGMDASQLARLFQPFAQLGDAEQREGGTGLGLAISRELVRRMGGDIEVRSRPGVGSRFEFEIRLPVATPSAPRDERPARITGYEGRRRRVLVIDDVALNRTLISALLGGLGFEMFEAPDGLSGLDLARHTLPDLVIMDILMPRLDGYAATRAIRQDPSLSGVPVVAATASVTQEVEQRFREAGGNAFLHKPIVLRELQDVIGKVMGLQWILEASGGDAGVRRE